jgi:ABC-type antimicrobial peptide transport system permease subunit
VVWEPDPPKPPENADKDYWESIQKQPHEITAEIIGVVTNGMEEGQNYISMDWARKLMVTKNWEFDEEKRKQMDEEQRQRQEQIMQEWQRTHLDSKDKPPESYFQNNDFNYSSLMRIVKYDNLARSGYGSILVRVDSTDSVDKVAESIRALKLGANTAKTMMEQIKKIFALVGLIIGAIGGIVLFVAAIGIINTMIMATYERTREIGIMRATGATRATIRHLFIFEAAILGFLGGVIGLGISFILAKIGNSIGNQIALAEGIPITNIISFQPWLIISVIALTTIIGALAGLLPAIRASRLDPVEALRNE